MELGMNILEYVSSNFVNKHYKNVEYSVTFLRSSFIQNLFHIQVLQCIIFLRFELLHIDGFSLETILIRHLALLAHINPTGPSPAPPT